jgi:general secretion pathway protein G
MRKSQAPGFTLVELMIVMVVIMILAAVAVPSYTSAIRSAREAVLREDLYVLRNAIDYYTADKQKPPQSLDDLIQEGYLREIPEDPMTHRRDSWITETSTDLHAVDQTEQGIANIHSASQEQGPGGTPYSEW